MPTKYSKTIWVNNETPLSADNLNKLEKGLEQSTEEIIKVAEDINLLKVDVTSNKVLAEQANTKANSISKESLGLNKVENTSDIDKPISNATQTALDLKANKNEIPTTLPASDVYSWAKQPNKPTYTKEEIGLGNVNNVTITQSQVNQIETNQTNISNLQTLVNTNETDAETKISAINTQIENIKKVLTSNDVDYDTLQELVNALKNNVSDINDIFTELAKKANAAAVDAQLNYKANSKDVYNKTEIDTKEQALNDKIDVKANKTEIPTKVSQLENDEGYLKEHQSLENYYTKTQVYNKTESDNKYQAQGNYALKSELFSKNYNDLTNKPTIPTSTSQLKNDSNFLTEHQDISGKEDKKNLKSLAYKDSLSKSDVGLGNVTNEAQIPLSQKGSNGGVATLGSDGKVPSSQLPSYVDDVLEYTSKSLFPTSGETGKIYVDTSNNITYRWSGSQYVEISASLALGETSSTAYSGAKGKANADAIAALQSSKANSNDVYSISEIDNKIGDINSILDKLNGEVI